jgi:hypothetical protein
LEHQSAAQSASPTDPPAYVYAASDIRPRQAREIELCQRASHVDWIYVASATLGFFGAEYLNIRVLKSNEEPGVRLIGAGAVGLTWGMWLSGGYLSLPKCDPLWAYGTPPEGNVRSAWPMAAAVSLLALATAPFFDFIFLGPIPVHWTFRERSARMFIDMGAAAVGALLPYVLPPRTWAAKKEIERIRVGAMNGGPFFSYTLAF